MSPLFKRLASWLLALFVLGSVALAAPSSVQRPIPTSIPFSDPDDEALPEGAVARLGSLRFYHGAQMGSVAISPDGTLIASGGAWGIPKQIGPQSWTTAPDRRICLWDTASGKLVREITAPNGGVNGLAYSPDGNALAAGCWDRLCFFDVATGAKGAVVKCDEGSITGLQYVDGGKKVAAFHWCSVGLFNPGTGERLKGWKAWQGDQPKLPNGSTAEDCKASAVSPDGNKVAFLYSCYEPDPTGMSVRLQREHDLLRIFDAAGKQVLELDSVAAYSQCVAFSADGRQLLTVADRVEVWDATKGTKVREMSGEFAPSNASLTYSPNGKTFVIANTYNYSFSVWDAAKCEQLYQRAPVRSTHSMATHGNCPPPVFSSNGQRLVGACEGRVRIWDAATGSEMHRFPGHQATVGSLQFSADGSTLNTLAGASVCRWNTSDWKELTQVDVNGPDASLAPIVMSVAPDGKSFACRDKQGNAELRNSATRQRIMKLDLEGNLARTALFSSDGRRLLVLAQVEPDNYNLTDGRVFDVQSGTCVGRFTATKWPRTIRLSPDGSTVVWVDEDNGRLNVADVLTGKVVHRLGKEEQNRNSYFTRIVISPDGGLVAWSPGYSNDPAPTSPVRVFDLKTGKQISCWSINRPEKGDALIEGMAFSPDSHYLATVQSDETAVLVWEVRTGLERRRLLGHKHWPYSVAFSPDGRLLASGSQDANVLVWTLSGPNSAETKKAPQSANELTAAWHRLADADGLQVDKSVWYLVRYPEQSVTFLRERLQPVPTAKSAQVASLIADLDSDDFAQRDSAAAELEACEGLVAPAIKAALRGQPSLEARERLETVLAALPTEDKIPTGQGLRRMRAIEILERIGTLAACKLLKELGEGAAQARTTIEAKAAYRRATARRHPISETQGAAER